MFTTPGPRGPGRQLSPDQGAKLVMLAPIELNRLLMLLPSNVAPPAIASAIKMISIAYSVAVAPLSSEKNLCIRLRIPCSHNECSRHGGPVMPDAPQSRSIGQAACREGNS